MYPQPFFQQHESLLKFKWNHITPLFKMLNRLPISLGIQSNPTDLALHYLSNPIPITRPHCTGVLFGPQALQTYCLLLWDLLLIVFCLVQSSPRFLSSFLTLKTQSRYHTLRLTSNYSKVVFYPAPVR